MKIMIAVIGLTVAAGAVGYRYYDTNANYLKIDTRIVKVEPKCQLEWKSMRRARRTEIMECSEAVKLQQSNPDYSGHTVVQRFLATLAYKSPVNGRQVTTRVAMTSRYTADSLRIGNMVQMLAHKERAHNLREI